MTAGCTVDRLRTDYPVGNSNREDLQMRYPDARTQLEMAVANVESALRNLSDRLEDALPGRNRRRMSRAKRALVRRASSLAERVSPDRASSLVEDTRRTVREHPLRAALTAAIAGYCVWSLIRVANQKSGSGTFADRYRSSKDEGILRH